jgi:hypothetical protein
MLKRRIGAVLLAMFLGTALLGADVDCDFNVDNDNDCQFFCD